MVYVQNRFGKPLMPTKNHRMVRLLLNEGKAKVVRKNPFTIRLKIQTKEYVQPITLGVDAGSKHVGLGLSVRRKRSSSARNYSRATM